MNKKIILLDIDYTLFNTDLFRDKTYSKFMAILKQDNTPEFHVILKKTEKSLIQQGAYEPVTFAKTLAAVLQIQPNHEKVEALFYSPTLYKACLYPDVFPFLHNLSQYKDITLGVVSKGDISFQKRKISPIQQYFTQKNEFISPDKISQIPRIRSSYSGKTVLVVDDSAVFLSALKKLMPEAKTLCIKRENRYEKREEPVDFVPDATIFTLGELLPLIDKQEK